MVEASENDLLLSTTEWGSGEDFFNDSDEDNLLFMVEDVILEEGFDDQEEWFESGPQRVMPLLQEERE